VPVEGIQGTRYLLSPPHWTLTPPSPCSQTGLNRHHSRGPPPSTAPEDACRQTVLRRLQFLSTGFLLVACQPEKEPFSLQS
jgi:hypothetical protein